MVAHRQILLIDKMNWRGLYCCFIKARGIEDHGQMIIGSWASAQEMKECAEGPQNAIF